MRKLSLAILMAAALGAAQLDPNTATVTATRTLNVQPDQVLLYVNLLAARDAGLDDVLAKLAGTGITAAQLSSVSAQFGPAIPNGVTSPLISVWTFTLPVSFSNMKGTVSALSQLASSLGSMQRSPVLTFNAVGVRNSPELLASQPCPMTALISDARKQADNMAAAAGMRTGAIVSVSDGTSVDGGVPIGGIPIAAARLGDFSQSITINDPVTGPPIFGTFSSIVSAPQPGCSLTVQFKLF